MLGTGSQKIALYYVTAHIYTSRKSNLISKLIESPATLKFQKKYLALIISSERLKIL